MQEKVSCGWIFAGKSLVMTFSIIRTDEVRAVLFEGACAAQETAKGSGFAAIGRRRLLQSF